MRTKAVLPRPAPEKPSVLSLLMRALEALDESPSAHAHSEAEVIRGVVGAMETRILAEVEILKTARDVEVPVLVSLSTDPSPSLRAWASAVLDARALR